MPSRGPVCQASDHSHPDSPIVANPPCQGRIPAAPPTPRRRCHDRPDSFRPRQPAGLSEITGTKDADIEDLFDRDFYLQLVSLAYERDLPRPITALDINAADPRVVRSVEAYAARWLPWGAGCCTLGRRPGRADTNHVCFLQPADWGHNDEQMEAAMHRAGRPCPVRGLPAVLAAVTVAAASCGAASQPDAAHVHLAHSPSASTAHARGPSGSRSLAEQTSRRLWRHLVLPPDARPFRSRPLPRLIRNATETLSGRHVVSRYEVFAVSRPSAWVYRYILRHVRAGLTSGDAGTSGPSDSFATWSPKPLPAGLEYALLEVTVISAGQGALIRADTQVMWYPPRSQAEYIDAAQFSAVRLWSHLLNPRPHTVRRVITSRAVIARLAGTLNALHAGQGLTYTCVASDAEYLITFVPATASQPTITAAPDAACLSVGVAVGGKGQPSLVGGGATVMLINRLLGITKAKAPAARR